MTAAGTTDDPGTDEAIAYAAGAWSKGGHLNPPADLTTTTSRNLWRMVEGATRWTQATLDRFATDRDPMKRQPTSEDLVTVCARALIIFADRGGYVIGDANEALELAQQIVDEAVRRVERDAATGEPNGHEREAEQPATDVTRALRTLDHFEVVKAEYLWAPYIPIGALTLLGGDYGMAKTWITTAIVAPLTRAWPMPCGKTAQMVETFTTPARALILTAENDPATLRFRLDRLGGDPSLVTIWDTRVAPLPSLTEWTMLEQAMELVKPRILVIDPLQSALGARVDINRANEVRPLLDRLVALARRHNCAVLVVMHLNKASTLSAKHRLLGSIDFAAAARSIMIASPVPDEPKKRALVHLKCSIAREGVSLGFMLDGDDDDVTFTWDAAPLDINLDDALQTGTQRRGTDTKVGAACQFLRELLRGGPRTFEYVMAEAAKVGLAESTVKRASTVLKVSKASFGFPRTTTWELKGAIV